MSKKIIAFYDVLLFAVSCVPLLMCSIFIFVFGELNDLNWCIQNWYFVVLFAVGIMLPIGGLLLFRYFVIHNNETAYFHYFPFSKDWGKAANSIDARWNQSVFISEIKDVEIVELTEEEKETLVFYKHWFNKYLKINLYYGNSKYVYVGNYSSFQIKKIIQLLTSKK